MVTTNVKILEGAYNYFGNYKGNGCKYSGNHGVSPFNGYKYTGNHGEDPSLIAGMAHIMEGALSMAINSTVWKYSGTHGESPSRVTNMVEIMETPGHFNDCKYSRNHGGAPLMITSTVKSWSAQSEI